MPTPDPNGHLLLVGQTTSRDFPVDRSAFQPRYGGGKSDGVLAIVDAKTSRLVYASYLGGSGEEIVRSVALDVEGHIFLIGSTTSDDFPISDDAFQRRRGGDVDAFVVKLCHVR